MSYCLGYGLDTSGSHPPTPPSWMRRQSCVRVLHVSRRRIISCSLAAAAARSFFRELEMLWRHFGFVRARKRSMHNVRGGRITRVFPQ